MIIFLNFKNLFNLEKTLVSTVIRIESESLTNLRFTHFYAKNMTIKFKLFVYYRPYSPSLASLGLPALANLLH